MHEVGKYLRLCLGGNPTYTELLWANRYETITPIGEKLINARFDLLGLHQVRASYTGFARQQASRLARRHEEGKMGFDSDLQKRTRKHGRHCWRLLLQAEQLIKTGRLELDVSEQRDEIFLIGDLAETNLGMFQKMIDARVDRIDQIEDVSSPLMIVPRREIIDDLLIEIRMMSIRHKGW